VGGRDSEREGGGGVENAHRGGEREMRFLYCAAAVRSAYLKIFRGGGGHFCGRVARLATSQGLLDLPAHTLLLLTTHTAPPQDPTVGLCLGPHREVGISYERGTPVWCSLAGFWVIGRDICRLREFWHHSRTLLGD